MKNILTLNLFSLIIILFFSSCDNNPLITFQEKIYQGTDIINNDTLSDTTWVKYITASELNLREEPDIKSKIIGLLKKDDLVYIDTIIQSWTKVTAIDSITGYVATEHLSEEFIHYKKPNIYIVDFFTDKIVDYFSSIHKYWIYAIITIIGLFLFYYVYKSEREKKSGNNIAFYSWGIIIGISGIISVFTNSEVFGFNAIFVIFILISIIFSIIQVKKLNATFKDILRKYLLLPFIIITSFMLGQVIVLVVIIAVILIIALLSGAKGDKAKFSNMISSGNKTSSTKSTKKTPPQNFICKYCGQEDISVQRLTHGICPNSPTKKHQVFEGGIQSIYICKHCGQESNSMQRLTHGICPNSLTKKHHAFKGGIQSMYICKHCGQESNSMRRLTHGICLKSPTKKHQPLK